jgi:uncharacterized protein (TIGR02594 family)
MDQPAWLEHAWRELGERESAGSASNPRVMAFYREVGHADVADDEVAWCAAFVGACLERAGEPSTRSLLARSYLEWGEPLVEPMLGALAVLSRGTDPGAGHVGFVVGRCDGRLVLLGGNQQDAVTVQAFDDERLLGFRWPTRAAPDAKVAEPQAANEPGGIFDIALKHVLEMEGGYTDDPYDPGGPTNLGITLAVYAAHRGIALADATAGALTTELKALSVATAREIYAARYWAPCKAPQLPPPVALMHFDAAVNHGVGTAARMLQQAVAVTVDGEIGPETLKAVRAAPSAELIARYADIRRARYRSLGHFWRFGRGWLARVDRTLAQARALAVPARARAPDQPQPSNGELTMEQAEPAQTPTKWWGQSMTVWGAVITALSTVLPVMGPLVGLDLSADLIRQLGDEVVRTAQALGGLIGIIMTIYGRSRATTQLQRREVTLQL